MDRRLAKTIAGVKSGDLSGGSLAVKLKTEISFKEGLINRYWADQRSFGISFPRVYFELQRTDQFLRDAELIAEGNLDAGPTFPGIRSKADKIVLLLEHAKKNKQELESQLHAVAGRPTPPPPKISLNTLHSFDLTQGEQGQLAVAATSPSGTDTTDANLLNADAAIKNAYASNGFVGRHERDYAKLGISNPSNPDTWPQGQTVLYFVAFDLFKTPIGATKAAEASRVDAVANDFTPITGSPLGEGEVILQKLPVGSDVLSTVIVLQRGQVVVKIASACRGCPLGTLPADAAAFAKAQLAQAEAKGLPQK